MLFVILVLVFSIPAVQTSLGNYATNKLNEAFKTNINIEKVGLQFNGDVELKNIYVEDFKQDTLISIKELNTSILNFSNLINGQLVFGDIDIMDLIFNIKTYKGYKETNLDVFVAKLEGDNPKKGDGSFLLSSSDVSIYDSTFRLLDENRETTKVLELEDLNINATNFLILGSDVSTRINTLSFKDSRGVKVKNLMTNFKYTLSSMTFDALEIKTANSILKGDLQFFYKREDLQFFTDKVQLEASFKDSNILMDELNTFYDEFGKNQKTTFSVDLSGTLNDLNAENLELNTSSNTLVYGDIIFKNLFSKASNDFLMDGSFKNLTSTYKDLKALLPNVLGAAIPSSFDRLGKFKITGNSQVTASEVDADIAMDTELGYVKSDLHITKINDIDNASYKGRIVLDTFNLGTFIEDPKVGQVSLDMNVNGHGFVAETIDTEIKGDVYQLNYNNYNYNKTQVSGKIKNKIFDGILLVNDDNLKLKFNGLIDYSETINKYDFEAEVDYADLNTLNFVKKDSISIFRSTVNMNMNSSSLDDAFGKITFRNTSYKNEHDTYNFKSFKIASRFQGKTRYIDIDSPDIIEGGISGEFNVRDIVKLLENSVGNIYTNYKPHKVADNQRIDFNLKIYNKIVEVIYPEIELGKNTFIRGNIQSEANKFKLTFKSPQIKLLENFAKGIELQVDNGNPLFNTYIEVDSINTKYYNASKFSLINVTVNDTLFMRSEFSGGKRNNDKFNLSFYHTINEDNNSVIGFKTSDVIVKNYKWYINGDNDKFNKISFAKDLSSLEIDKLNINHGNEEVTLSGFIKDSTEKDLKLKFKDVRLSKIIPDVDSLKLNGRVNGKLDILQKNGSYLPNSTVVIDNFKVNDFPLGDFNAQIIGNKDLTKYNVDVSIIDDIKSTFSAIGDISVKRNNTNIDVDLEFDRFNLSPLNPLLSGVLSNIRGKVTGEANIIGNLNRPNIVGELNLDGGGFTIPYLNVDYQFNNNATVGLENQSFLFRDILLTDTKYNSTARLNGKLSHINLSDWRLDLGLSTGRLLVLDTKETEESLYYGTGFVGGTASIYGPTEELVISVVGETKRGTVFKIPLSDTESFGDNSFIHFITPEQKLAREKGEEFVLEDVEGLELDFDLDVTQDAELEIIINKETGHALKGRGVGGVLVEINTNGKFDMWGDFSVFEGVYNFAYGGLVQKQFTVQPGGTIAWNGDPLRNTTINMLATYKTQTNPSPLLDNPINRSIPVELNITLTGDLERPQPTFDFEFPNANSTIKSELQYRLDSDAERENQALYFLATGGSFQNRGSGELNVSGTIAERLNGIVNGIFSSEDGKVNFGFNYEAGQNRPDYQTDDRVVATFQTQINDKVFFNGSVGVPVGGAGETQTVVAGDLEINFLLNEDGTLSAKVFNREVDIQSFGQDIGYKQGVGLSYNVDFDTFKELIRSLFKKNPKPKEVSKEEPQEKEAEALPSFITVKSSKK
ncbi:translocation/assembly module TamB domain-containing protein [Hyunsoonleella pacifica]|uniref:Translocation/assembly module TamB n=1 Tax=Hyunsoonleella pacifica TaxID=1080224 RepID=A0A4Q9FSS8_9FLAO|nr:translocation/assembly module TamB domain-containing protein [Hyunsoonleella pacifica]TBN17916.1 translocation/assembly module TamB [Hyunsoonleella pacifica]